jgi:hypothetical protein
VSRGEFFTHLFACFLLEHVVVKRLLQWFIIDILIRGCIFSSWLAYSSWFNDTDGAFDGQGGIVISAHAFLNTSPITLLTTIGGC